MASVGAASRVLRTLAWLPQPHRQLPRRDAAAVTAAAAAAAAARARLAAEDETLPNALERPQLESIRRGSRA